MNVSVIGTGYVGATTSAALAELGHQVIGVDVDQKKVGMLNAGRLPFYEEGLETLMQALLKKGALAFTTDLARAVTGSDILFLTVGTPSQADGSANLRDLEQAVRQIGRALNGHKIIVSKSTVPVGTGERVKAWLQEEVTKRGLSIPFDVVSNPEFLREGKALHDALHPERIVIGCESDKARAMMTKLYQGMQTDFCYTTVRDAEMIKYASNSFLATKISFMNELARLCEQTDTSISKVAHGMGLDSRIGSQFLRAGIGYGGSCFPKDVEALLHLARENGVPLRLLDAVATVNREQSGWFLQKVRTALGTLSGKQIALLGLTFKPGTDDIREAPALKLIPVLLAAGAQITAYDPKGMEAVGRLHPKVRCAKDAYAALDGADAALLLTEWPEFLKLDFARVIGSMRKALFFDGRNALDGAKMRSYGFTYDGVGERGTA
ncbi:nucleotide sugar dehydrogenase [Tumebacillus algifaecis]|uniref:UDP-glucose 6-dehydrogenase n=1 Tax=Tumebacillus algifaecis TaxID=1214604 RepID=A0A223D0R9_9BACL|nr:UDP-glucose/GDP-mannose dehydrogenase family protein [Tumebacillus algifaecis]ASS75141.1 nucleotide sugar dehydrogenase [Tumebacillus algifaecis]